MDLQSQLDLPFLETNQIHLPQIFSILAEKFGLKNNSNQLFLDLGAGNGSVVIFSAVNYNIRSKGIEIDPLLVEEAKYTIRALRSQKVLNKRIVKKIKIVQGDFYELDLKNYDYIYIYSLPTMQKYLKHVFKTARLGVIIISHMYPLRDFEKDLQLEFELNHNGENHKNITYFYRKVKLGTKTV